MTDDEIRDIADRVIESLNNVAPGGPEWWEIFVAFVPLLALVAVIIIASLALGTLLQKRGADDRREWWKRTQWALDAKTSENPKMVAYGRGLLKLLLVSKMASADDKAVFDAIWSKSETTMDDDSIQQLVREIAAAGGLTADEQSSIEGVIDDSQASKDNRPTKEES